jgi:protein-tyrosine phosphatase
MEESVQSCRALKLKGIKGIVATPHYIPGSTYVASAKTVNQKVSELESIISEKVPGLNILKGMELYISPELPDLLKSKEVLTLNDTKYILVETSLNSVPPYMEDVLFKLQLDGYIPVLAHPERYCNVLDMDRIENLVSKGVLLQVNLNSIMGKYGKDVRLFATRLLTRGLAHFAATDSHGRSDRFTNVEAVKTLLRGFIGMGNAEKLLVSNPQRLVDNKDVEYLKPVQSKSFFRMFKDRFKL